jgi:hypothetical protein
MREANLDGLGAAPRWIGMCLGAYSIADLLVLYFWSGAGQIFSMQASSDSISALPVTAMAAVNLFLCLVVLRGFPAGAPLRPAWVLATGAAAAQAVPGVMAQVLETDSLRTPLLTASGPIRLALLALALLPVLRILRGFGFWVRPSATDWAVSGIVCLFALCRFAEAGVASPAAGQTGLQHWISLAGLPFLCVLVLEAMLLRQSVVRMGNGPISKCWAALMGGIFLTGLAELAVWVVPHYSRVWPPALIEWLTRFPIAAVFALAPAYQVAAQRRATKPAASAPEELAAGVPALAR